MTVLLNLRVTSKDAKSPFFGINIPKPLFASKLFHQGAVKLTKCRFCNFILAPRQVINVQPAGYTSTNCLQYDAHVTRLAHSTALGRPRIVSCALFNPISAHVLVQALLKVLRVRPVRRQGAWAKPVMVKGRGNRHRCLYQWPLAHQRIMSARRSAVDSVGRAQ